MPWFPRTDYPGGLPFKKPEVIWHRAARFVKTSHVNRSYVNCNWQNTTQTEHTWNTSYRRHTDVAIAKRRSVWPYQCANYVCGIKQKKIKRKKRKQKNKTKTLTSIAYLSCNHKEMRLPEVIHREDSEWQDFILQSALLIPTQDTIKFVIMIIWLARNLRWSGDSQKLCTNIVLNTPKNICFWYFSEPPHTSSISYVIYTVCKGISFIFRLKGVIQLVGEGDIPINTIRTTEEKTTTAFINTIPYNQSLFGGCREPEQLENFQSILAICTTVLLSLF